MSGMPIRAEDQRAGIHWIGSQPVPVRTVNEFGVDVMTASSLIAVQMAAAMDKAVVDAIIAEASRLGAPRALRSTASLCWRRSRRKSSERKRRECKQCLS